MNNCPACELLLKNYRKTSLIKCKICGHYYHRLQKKCLLDHEIRKKIKRGKK